MSFANFDKYSAAIVSFKAPNGQELNLKFDNPDNYRTKYNAFLGASVGRYANRIFGSKINVKGETYKLDSNEGASTTLHGGSVGWAKQDWQGPFQEEHNGKKATVFKITSDHLDQGFPGKVEARAIYTTSEVARDDGTKEHVLELEYECRLADDSPVDETVVNMTNHAHMNVAPNPSSIAGTRMKLFGNESLLKNEKGEITGEAKPFPAVPSDKSFFTLGAKEPDFDDAFVMQDLSEFSSLDTRSSELKPMVHYYHPENNVNLKIFSTEPIAQIYACGFMNIPKLDGESRDFPVRCGIACEPGRPTNAVNIDKWRQWVTLKKGDVYGSRIVYSTWVGDLKEY